MNPHTEKALLLVVLGIVLTLTFRPVDMALGFYKDVSWRTPTEDCIGRVRVSLSLVRQEMWDAACFNRTTRAKTTKN